MESMLEVLSDTYDKVLCSDWLPFKISMSCTLLDRLMLYRLMTNFY
jgi:hypothetical protein